MSRPPIVRLVAALILGAIGGLAFHLVGLPAAWLAGSMVVVSVATILGLRAPFPTPFRTVLFILLGLSMGSGVSPELLQQIAAWPLSMVLLVVTLAAVTAGVFLFLSRLCGWDRASSFFSSIPGALSYVLAVAQVSQADLRRVALAQSVRVFLLVAFLPGIIVLLGDAPLRAPPTTSPDLLHLGLLVVAGAAGGLLAERLHIPAGAMLGAFAVSALLYATGTVHGVIPQPIQIAGFIGLGVMTGLRFTGISPGDLWRNSAASLGAFVVGTVLSMAGALAASYALGISIAETFIAFAPGGLEAMIILAFAIGLDPSYVAAHHLARFLAMVFVVPFVARRLLGKGWSSPAGKV